MGDRTSLTVRVKADPRVARAAYELIADVLDSADESLVGEGAWAWYDVSVGSADSVAWILHGLLDEGYEDEDEERNSFPPHPFAWKVWEDPKYEWMGSLYAHVPGVGSYVYDCDSDGTPRLTPDAILAILERAASPVATLQDAREALRAATGQTVLEAYDAYEPPALPTQEEIPV